ncbi:hypothetical protein PGT21_037246 [Puccinia graminis f. sp. tritici]|uniref:Uncharacterized protein n=1 Tax=Puccinia graminis f. sp. tritici TaxID=56615 RepID=A0A5B0R465_PUCGR|nr:hypothetical protein PGT21_037246 [Puccinia graminis f. sp. tritici]
MKVKSIGTAHFAYRLHHFESGTPNSSEKFYQHANLYFKMPPVFNKGSGIWYCSKVNHNYSAEPNNYRSIWK